MSEQIKMLDPMYRAQVALGKVPTEFKVGIIYKGKEKILYTDSELDVAKEVELYYKEVGHHTFIQMA